MLFAPPKEPATPVFSEEELRRINEACTETRFNTVRIKDDDAPTTPFVYHMSEPLNAKGVARFIAQAGTRENNGIVLSKADADALAAHPKDAEGNDLPSRLDKIYDRINKYGETGCALIVLNKDNRRDDLSNKLVAVYYGKIVPDGKKSAVFKAYEYEAYDPGLHKPWVQSALTKNAKGKTRPPLEVKLNSSQHDNAYGIANSPGGEEQERATGFLEKLAARRESLRIEPKFYRVNANRYINTEKTHRNTGGDNDDFNHFIVTDTMPVKQFLKRNEYATLLPAAKAEVDAYLKEERKDKESYKSLRVLAVLERPHQTLSSTNRLFFGKPVGEKGATIALDHTLLCKPAREAKNEDDAAKLSLKMRKLVPSETAPRRFSDRSAAQNFIENITGKAPLAMAEPAHDSIVEAFASARGAAEEAVVGVKDILLSYGKLSDTLALPAPSRSPDLKKK